MSKRDPQNRLGNIPIAHRPDRDKWQLTIRKDGKRIRSLHDTEEKALTAWRAHCKILERHGTQGESISKDEGREYLEAKRIAGQMDLRDVATFWRQHHPEGMLEIAVSDAVAEFVEHKSAHNLSARHFHGMRGHLLRFSSSQGSRPLRSISGNDALDWLTYLNVEPRTVRNYQNSLANFFNWSVRRGYLARSPVASIHETDLPKIKQKPKGILTVDQCAAMMAHLATADAKYIPWHALQLFAGIRRAEAGRMTWDMIDLERKIITLPASIVKTGDDWALHDLPANLWPWLAVYRGTGRIASPGRKTVKRIREGALPSLPVPIPQWPANAMRHTFCTMMMSLHGDAVKVATWSRHTNTAQLFKSYVAKLVSKEEAERFANIIPCPLA